MVASTQDLEHFELNTPLVYSGGTSSSLGRIIGYADIFHGFTQSNQKNTIAVQATFFRVYSGTLYIIIVLCLSSLSIT
jgi:hypothetical protein